MEIKLFIWATLLIGSTCLLSSTPDRLDEYKAKVGFTNVMNRRNAAQIKNAFIVNGIPDISRCPVLQGDWQLLDDSMPGFSHGDEFGDQVNKQYCFSGPRGRAFVEFSFSMNSDNAENSLFDFVLTTSRYPIPGTRGPEDIGDFSIQINRGRDLELMFYRCNIFVKIMIENRAADIYAIARWIQSSFQMESRLSVQDRLPRPTREIIGKQNVREGLDLFRAQTTTLQGKVGEPIEINLEMSGDRSQYLIQEDFDNHRFRSTMINNVLSIIPIKPGRGSFRYVVIDKKTLLFSTCEVPVDVQP